MSGATKVNKEEILKIEDNYNKQIFEVALYDENKGSLDTQRTYKEIKVDAIELFTEATGIINENTQIADKDVAIELLKNIALKGKSKFMRKLAAEMLSEKWWDK